MSVYKNCNPTEFVERFFRSIYTYDAPIDFSSSTDVLKRLDRRTKSVIINETERENAITERNADIMIDVLKTVLLIDIPGEKKVLSDYTKYIDDENIMWEGNDSVPQYIFGNTLLMLLELRFCFGNLACIEAIEHFLINEDYHEKPRIDTNLENIGRFVFMVYRYILNNYKNRPVILGSDVIIKLLKTRFYSEVYLMLCGYIIDCELDESGWLFGLQQAGRISVDCCLSAADKKGFEYHSDFMITLNNNIDQLSGKSDEDSIRKIDELKYMQKLILIGREKNKDYANSDQ